MARCCCGKPYYPDSTGEDPCHIECDKCGKPTEYPVAGPQGAFQLCDECYREWLMDKLMRAAMERDGDEIKKCANVAHLDWEASFTDGGPKSGLVFWYNLPSGTTHTYTEKRLREAMEKERV